MTVNCEVLTRYLGLYAEDVIRVKMRDIVIDAHGSGIEEGTGARLTWLEDGSFSLGDFGRYYLTVTVSPLPELPPIGPEESKQHPCVECLTDPDEDPRSWCDCGGSSEQVPCKPPCVQRAHDPNVCPNLIYVCETCNSGGHTCPGDGNSIKHGQSDCGEHDEPEWMPATWRYVLKGDRVRLGESEAEVTASNVSEWHVDASDYWRPKPWEHTEVKVQLKHTGKVWLPWPPDSEVEILMDGTRKAAYVLQQTFPGTREVE